MKSKINKPDLLNGNKQFKFALKNNIITSNNFNKTDIKETTFNISFYLNLLAIIIIILTIIILIYKFSNKDNKKNQISKFIQQVQDYSNYNSSEEK